MNTQYKSAVHLAKEELSEIIGSFSKIFTVGIDRKKRYPSRYSPWIWHKLTGSEVNSWCFSSQKIGHCIRQVHDFYGWMAKHGPHGKCAGTIYRTESFLSLKKEERDGTRGESRSIHIEHTVPIADLTRALRQKFTPLRPQTPSELHSFLLAHSICVAFSHDDEMAMRKCGVSVSRNCAFDTHGVKIHQNPFVRYNPLEKIAGVKIINIITGKNIDLTNFTFDDHMENLMLASDTMSHRCKGFETRPSAYSLDIFSSNDWNVT